MEVKDKGRENHGNETRERRHREKGRKKELDDVEGLQRHWVWEGQRPEDPGGALGFSGLRRGCGGAPWGTADRRGGVGEEIPATIFNSDPLGALVKNSNLSLDVLPLID